MSLATEYRGYTIRYSENNDTWDCYDCKVSAETLTKAKAAIDALHLKVRKAAAVPCYEIQKEMFSVALLDATVIDYLGPAKTSDWVSSKKIVTGQRVASVCKRRGSARASRADCHLSSLVKPGPEVEAIVAELAVLGEAKKAASQAFEDAVNRLPKLQIEDIKDLIEASEHRFEE